MPGGETSHPRGPENPCNVCWVIVGDDDAPLLGHNSGCGSAEMLHWFCSPCLAHLHACPPCRRAHPLCTAPPPRETQTEDLTLHTLRTLIAQNVWVTPEADGRDSPEVMWLDVLGHEDPAAAPPCPPWRAPTWALPDGEEDPTIWVQDDKQYGGVPLDTLPPVGNLRDSSGPVGPMNCDNWRTTILSFTTFLPFTFSWLVGDAEEAVEIARGAHGHEWGAFFRRSRAMTKGGLSNVERDTPPAQTPASGASTSRPPNTRPTTTAGHVRQCSSGPDDGPGCTTPQLLHLHPESRHHHHPALAAHHSFNRGYKCTCSGTIRDRRATKSNDLHVLQPIHVHPQRDHPLTRLAADYRSHKDYGPSGTIGGRHATKPPARTCRQTGGTTTPAAAPHGHSNREHQTSPAGREIMPRHTSTATTSARPEKPLGTMRPQTGPGPGPAGDPGPQPKTPPDASTRGQRAAAPTQANPELHLHHSPPVRPTASPTHTRSDGLPTQTRTSTPTDATGARPERPLGTMGAPLPRPQQHPARQPQGTICRNRHRPNRHPMNARTHQPDRQNRPQTHHPAVPWLSARTRPRTRRALPSRPTPHGRTRQGTSS